MKKETKLENSRRHGFTEDVISGWFQKVKQVLDRENLHFRPNQIWNADESGFSDETLCKLCYLLLIERRFFLGEYVCVRANTKHVFEQNGGSGKNFTTVLLCSNAAGEILPPFVIYGAKSVNPLWCLNGPSNALYRCTDSGWISELTFIDWFINCFLVQTKNIDRPLLLVMDNHPSHINIDIIELAMQNNVIILCLPPHTTHALQPLDVVTFRYRII